MSRLSADVALTSGGMTRLVDRMVDPGLCAWTIPVLNHDA
jgi:hypothetical protein